LYMLDDLPVANKTVIKHQKVFIYKILVNTDLESTSLKICYEKICKIVTKKSNKCKFNSCFD